MCTSTSKPSTCPIIKSPSRLLTINLAFHKECTKGFISAQSHLLQKHLTIFQESPNPYSTQCITNTLLQQDIIITFILCLYLIKKTITIELNSTSPIRNIQGVTKLGSRIHNTNYMLAFISSSFNTKDWTYTITFLVNNPSHSPLRKRTSQNSS